MQGNQHSKLEAWLMWCNDATTSRGLTNLEQSFAIIPSVHPGVNNKHSVVIGSGALCISQFWNIKVKLKQQIINMTSGPNKAFKGRHPWLINNKIIQLQTFGLLLAQLKRHFYICNCFRAKKSFVREFVKLQQFGHFRRDLTCCFCPTCVSLPDRRGQK